jgi:hypothetical protein
MAFEPDRVVVELIAKTDNFDGKVKQSASTNEASMNKIIADSSKAEAAVTRGSSSRSSAIQREAREISAASRLLGTQINDIGALVASPRSPFVAIPKQAPAVSSAMKSLTLVTGALGGIFAGAAAAGAALLIDHLMKLADEAGSTESKIADLVEEMKESAQKAQLAAEAEDIFKQSLEGVERALDANEKALDKLNDTGKTAARIALEQAVTQQLLAQRHREAAIAALDEAQAQVELNNARNKTAGNDPRITGPLNAENAALSRQITEQRERLVKANNAIVRSEGQINQALSRRLVELGKEQADPLEAIRQKYDGPKGLIEQARKRAIAEGTVGVALKAQVRELEKARKLEEDAYRDSQRRQRSTRDPNAQSGRTINDAEAKAIAMGLGLSAAAITSQTRSAATNQRVGGVGNSLHLSGQAIDIDKKLANAAGLTLGKIVAAFEKKGVRVIEKLDEGDHYHLGFAKRGGRGRQGPSAETLEARRIAAADAAERREQAFENERAGLRADELDARRALITSQEQIAQIELAAIEVVRAKYEDNVNSLIETRRLTADEGKELIAINNERAKLRKELVLRREAERRFREQEAAFRRAGEFQSAVRGDEASVLQGRLEVAKTAKERAAIERRLLDLQFQEERAALQAVVNYNERLKLQANVLESERLEAQAAATIAQLRLDSLGQRQAAAEESQAQAQATPLQSYFSGIQAEADDLNAAFERIAAGGLQNFEDKLTDAITNFRSLADVGRAVLAGLTQDLVRLAIRMVLNATIGKLVSKVATASSAAQGAALAAAWAPAAAAVSLASFGANAAPAAAAIASTNALALGFAAAGGAAAGGAAAFADGGRIYGPGTPTSDSVPIRASRDEFMIRAASARKLGYDVLESINRNGELPQFATGGRVRRLNPSNAQASRGFSGGFGASDITQLRGIIGEAVNAGVSAMPDVSLYASLDPADMLQRALGTGPGQKALIAALESNSSQVKTVLR